MADPESQEGRQQNTKSMQAALVAIVSARKQRLGQGNIFTPVSQSFYPGGCLPLGLRGVHPLWTHTPWTPPTRRDGH